MKARDSAYTRFNGGATGQDLRDPMATVTANSWIKKPGGAAPLRLVAPILSQLYGSGGGNGDLLRPHPAVTAEGQHSSVIAPILTYVQQGGGNRPILAPHHTICASNKDQNSIAASFLARHFGRSVGHPAEEPNGSITARGGGKFSPVAAFLAQQNNDSRRAGGVNPGRAATAPLSSICATGSHQNLVAAWFAKYYGTGDGARHDDPAHTVTAKDRLAHMQADLVDPPFSAEHETKARAVADLLRSYELCDDREFVTLSIGGAEFVIVDIGMQMLTPRELFRAQGFPEDYVIEGVWEGETFKPFAKHVQVSCCGNSVCSTMAEALVWANCGHLSIKRDGEDAAQWGRHAMEAAKTA